MAKLRDIISVFSVVGEMGFLHRYQISQDLFEFPYREALFKSPQQPWARYPATLPAKSSDFSSEVLKFTEHLCLELTFRASLPKRVKVYCCRNRCVDFPRLSQCSVNVSAEFLFRLVKPAPQSPVICDGSESGDVKWYFLAFRY